MKTSPANPVCFYSWRRRRTDKYLKELYLGLREGRVFSDRDIHPNEQLDMMPSVFMALGLGGPSIVRFLKLSQTALIYENMSEAGPRSINGYPIFFSFQTLNQADVKRLWEIRDKVEAALSEIE